MQAVWLLCFAKVLHVVLHDMACQVEFSGKPILLHP